METLTMSRNERARLTIMRGVTDGELTVVQAAELMAVSYRQSKRIWKRYQADGDAGLVHRLRSKPSFGAMVQLDRSRHDWFEGRGPKCVLMVMVDDATSRIRARCCAEEATRASYDALAGWGRKHGLPASLYVDRDRIYRCEGEPSLAQQLAGQAPQTQFGRAMAQLGVKLILAHSQQVKGRVERMNGTLQDRRVKELRLAGISDLESANRFLEEKYLRAFHRQFGREAASPVDVHREVPRNLDEVLSREEERVVQGDWTGYAAGSGINRTRNTKR